MKSYPLAQARLSFIWTRKQTDEGNKEIHIPYLVIRVLLHRCGNQRKKSDPGTQPKTAIRGVVYGVSLPSWPPPPAPATIYGQQRCARCRRVQKERRTHARTQRQQQCGTFLMDEKASSEMLSYNRCHTVYRVSDAMVDQRTPVYCY